MKLFEKVIVTKRNLIETGLILILLDLIWIYSQMNNFQIIIGLVLVILALFIPWCFYPFSWILLFVGRILNLFMPTIILGIIFHLLVTPVGLMRRLAGKDSLHLRKFKQNKESVFIDKKSVSQLNQMHQPY